MSTTDLESRLALLRDAVPTAQLNQLDELIIAIQQAGHNVAALVKLCSTRKQTAALLKLLNAFAEVNTATDEFVESVELDAYDRDGNPRWSVA